MVFISKFRQPEECVRVWDHQNVKTQMCWKGKIWYRIFHSKLIGHVMNLCVKQRKRCFTLSRARIFCINYSILDIKLICFQLIILPIHPFYSDLITFATVICFSINVSQKEPYFPTFGLLIFSLFLFLENVYRLVDLDTLQETVLNVC